VTKGWPPKPWPLSIFIPGHPRAYGSKVPNSWGHGVRDSSKYIAAWKKHVREEMEAKLAGEWASHADAAMPLIGRGQPVATAFRFYLPMPKGLKLKADPFPLRKAGDYAGDWDKMARAVGDCGTDVGLWWDDCQIVTALVTQRWAHTHPAGVVVMFWPEDPLEG
jgi:Holliday junction resolvase RusA-like endonuclease